MFFSFWTKQCLDKMVGSITFTKIPLSLFALISWSPKRAHWCFSELQWCVLSLSGSELGSMIIFLRSPVFASSVSCLCLISSVPAISVCLRQHFQVWAALMSLTPSCRARSVCSRLRAIRYEEVMEWVVVWGQCAVFFWAGRSSKPPARKCSFWMNGIKSILVFGLCCFIPLVYLRWPKVCFGWNSYFSIAKVQTSEFNQKLEFHKKKRFVRQLCSPIPGRPAGLSSRWPISRLSSLWNWHRRWVDTWCRSSI